jgi:hypothetical protein
VKERSLVERAQEARQQEQVQRKRPIDVGGAREAYCTGCGAQLTHPWLRKGTLCTRCRKNLNRRLIRKIP